jgi:hypothetical protein
LLIPIRQVLGYQHLLRLKRYHHLHCFLRPCLHPLLVHRPQHSQVNRLPQ